MSRDSWLFMFAALSAVIPLLQLLGVKVRPLGEWTKRPGIGAVLVAISLTLSVLGFYRSLNSAPRYDEDGTVVEVMGKTFRNENVDMDNKRFERCTFINVTYVYDGKGPVRISNCAFVGSIVLKSHNGAVTMGFGLMKGLGFTNAPAYNIKPGSILETPTPVPQ